MSYEMTTLEAANDGRMTEAAYNAAIQAVEDLARAEAAMRDALAKCARYLKVHTIDAEAVCNTLSDEIPTPDWLIEKIEEAYRG
jgi:hypothetical protein